MVRESQWAWSNAQVPTDAQGPIDAQVPSVVYFEALRKSHAHTHAHAQ
jgi:hypothetical protein